MKYEYDYVVSTKTTDFPYETEDSAHLITRAKATVSVLAPCEFVLQVSKPTN